MVPSQQNENGGEEMADQIKSLNAYLNFMGNCEEALNMYAKIFNGNVSIVNRYDNPAMNMPEEFRDKVLHATLDFCGIRILASDIIPNDPKTVPSGSGDAALSLDVSGPDEGKRIFDQLAEGGKVGVKFEKQFWGAWHGNLRDKYGVRWMLNCEG